MNRIHRWRKLVAMLALLTAVAACAEQSDNLRGAAVPQEAPAYADAQSSAESSAGQAVEDAHSATSEDITDTLAVQPVGSGLAGGVPALLPGAKEVPLESSALSAILADPAYQAALAPVTADGWTVDTANATVLTAADGRPGEAVRFEIRPEFGSRGRWKWLVYVANATGTAPKVYFVDAIDPTANSAEVADAAGASPFSNDSDAESGDITDSAAPQDACLNPGPWGPWKSSGPTFCAPNAMCVGQYKMATYQMRVRTRKCTNRLDYQFRTDFVKCGGCPAPSPNLSAGKLVWVSNRTGSRQIFYRDLTNNGPVTQLTSGHTSAGYPESRRPVWSPDGKYIAYIGIYGDEKWNHNSETHDVIRVIDTSGNEVWFHDQMLGTFTENSNHLHMLAWSPTGDKICFTHYHDWLVRGLLCESFPVKNATTKWSPFLSLGWLDIDLDPSELAFTPDNKTMYFTADSSAGVNVLYQLSLPGGKPAPVLVGSQPIRRAFEPSVAPSGATLIFNSEAYKDKTPGYDSQELVQLNLSAGTLSHVTEPGDQSGRFALRGSGEMVVQSSAVPGGNLDLFAQYGSIRMPMAIDDPSNKYSDFAADWYNP